MVSRRAGLPRRMLSEFRAGGTNVFQIIYEEQQRESLLIRRYLIIIQHILRQVVERRSKRICGKTIPLRLI